MSNLMKIFIVLLLVTFSLGCKVNLSLGKEFDRDATKDILPGRTTKSWVIKTFGTPQKSYRNSDMEVLEYNYMNEKGDHQELLISIHQDLVACYHLK